MVQTVIHLEVTAGGFQWVPGSDQIFFVPTPGYTKNLPLRLRKAGRVLSRGARETHLATCHNKVTPSKTKEFLKSLCFFRSQR